MLPYFTDRAWGWITAAILAVIAIIVHFIGG